MLKNPWFLSPHSPAFVKVLQLIFSVLGYPETETAQCLSKKLGVGRPFTTSCRSWNMGFQEVSSTLILDGGRMKKSFCSMFILPFTGFLHLRVVSRIASSNGITHFWKYLPLLWETIQSNLTTFRKPNISPPFRDIIVHSLVAIYWMRPSADSGKWRLTGISGSTKVIGKKSCAKARVLLRVWVLKQLPPKQITQDLMVASCEVFGEGTFGECW